MPASTTAEHKILTRSVRMPDGCWRWTGYTRNGYGQVHHQGRVWPAHRLSYVTFVGAVPDGLDLDHLCRNRACVNPDHLEPVTRSVNTSRGDRNGNQNKTHCSNGHPFDATNTRITKAGKRWCRACDRERRSRPGRKWCVPSQDLSEC